LIAGLELFTLKTGIDCIERQPTHARTLNLKLPVERMGAPAFPIKR